MLLLIVSFFAHYDLHNCEEIVKVKFNESSILNHHRQIRTQLNPLLEEMKEKSRKQSMFNADDYGNKVKRQQFKTTIKNISSSVLRSGISEKDQNNQNLKKTTEPPPVFLPSPQYGRLPPHQGLPPFLPGSQARPPAIPPDLNITKGPQYPGHQLIPINSIYPGLENASSHYLANRSYLRSIFGPKEQSLYKAPPFLGHFHIKPFSYSTIRTMYARIIPVRVLPSGPPSFYVSEHGSLHDSTLSTTTTTTTIRTTMGANAKVWFQEIAPYTPPRKKKTKASEDLSRSEHTETTVPILYVPRETTRNYWSLTGTAKTPQLVNTGENGYNNTDEYGLGTMQEHPNKNETTTIAGDVLYGKIKVQKPSTSKAPEQHHLELMEQLEEGYLMVFFVEMFRLIAVKKKSEVQEVLSPMRQIYNNLTDRGHLSFVGDPLQIVIEKLSIMASGEVTVDVIRTYSSMMFHTLLKRKEVLSPEVNSMIDQAEMFYSDEEGKRLLRSLSQFEDYPNTSQAIYLICKTIIENIIQPFRRPAIARSRKRLLDSVNTALQRRFPLLTRERVRPKVGSNLRERDINPTVRPKVGNNLSKRKFIVTVRPKIGTNTSERRRIHQHKMKRKRKRFLKPEFYNKQIKKRH